MGQTIFGPIGKIMSVYEDFIKKNNEIENLAMKTEKALMELTNIKRDIYKKHMKRFKQKPVGKTVVKDGGFEIVYNCTQKVTLLNTVIEMDRFESSCLVIKTTPEKKSLSFDKKEYKKLSDHEQLKVKKYVKIENNKPTINVLKNEE